MFFFVNMIADIDFGKGIAQVVSRRRSRWKHMTNPGLDRSQGHENKRMHMAISRSRYPGLQMGN